MLRLKRICLILCSTMSRHRKRLTKRLFYGVGAVLFVFVCITYIGKWKEQFEKIEEEPEIFRCDKWIVLTTIHSPTKTLRVLSMLDGWQTLVVGDRKTPIAFNLPNVIFLDVSKQKKLRYRIHQYIPYDSYSRKTIGFLYAIKHGAKFIYDVDDDNFPTYELDTFLVTSATISSLVLQTNNLTSNPYVHFGQSSLWPRGYPLERIGLMPDRKYVLCKTRCPAIQQGVVNGDPDVDALTRLIRKHPSSHLQLNFDQNAPSYLLPVGTYAPFNSQNTLFLHKAFWSMVLPTSVPDRVTDIYRSYWAQRLLWLIDEYLAFVPPNAFQKRAGHSDLKDAKDESELYHSVGHYIKLLTEWTCTKRFFSECISELSHHLVEAGFWKSSDADLVDAWISDLISIGYELPDMTSTANGPCISSSSLKVIYFPIEQVTSQSHDNILRFVPQSVNHDAVSEKLSELCGPAYAGSSKSVIKETQSQTDILLIVSVRHKFEIIVPVLEILYKLNFPRILYCTEQQVSDDFVLQWKTSVLLLKEAVSAMSCILSAHRMHYNVTGYLYTTDFTWLKAEHVHSLKQKSVIWMTMNFDRHKHSEAKLCKDNANECNVTVTHEAVLESVAKELYLMDALSNAAKLKVRACIGKKETPWKSQKNIAQIGNSTIYLPAHILPDLQRLNQDFTDVERSYNFVILLLLACEQPFIEQLQYTDELDSVIAKNEIDFVSPFLFEDVSYTGTDARKLYCDYFDQFH